MKINHTSHIQPKAPGAINRGDTTTPKTDFKTILKETVETAGGTQSTTESTAVVHPFATAPIKPVSSPVPDQTVPLVDRIDRFVDLLDRYRQKLEDPRASLKTIQPLLDDIAAAKDRLAPEVDRLEGGDGLKEVLNTSLVTAATEILRFNRGDYI